MKLRLQKYLAACGVASRRKAEELITNGEIFVNGKKITELGAKINPAQDTIEYKGNPVTPEEKIYIMLNKPKGYTCTTKSFKGEKNVLGLIDSKELLFPVGRLDKSSEGLLFLTNDGAWAYSLTHPKFQIEKEYIVTTKDPLTDRDLKIMRTGIEDDGEFLKIQKSKVLGNNTYSLILTQGKKREIRRLIHAVRNTVISLKRIRIGKWTLGSLKPGEWKNIKI